MHAEHSISQPPSDVNAWPATAAARLADELDPECVVLFGCYARGTQSRTSDLDIFVVWETSLGPLDRIGRVMDMLYDSPRPVEAVVYTPEELERTDPFFSSDESFRKAASCTDGRGMAVNHEQRASAEQWKPLASTGPRRPLCIGSPSGRRQVRSIVLLVAAGGRESDESRLDCSGSRSLGSISHSPDHRSRRTEPQRSWIFARWRSIWTSSTSRRAIPTRSQN